MALDALLPGQAGVVTDLAVGEGLQKRLNAFGLVPGTVVHCCYRSPDKTVTALAFRGTVLALRTKDLKNILVRC